MNSFSSAREDEAAKGAAELREARVVFLRKSRRCMVEGWWLEYLEKLVELATIASLCLCHRLTDPPL